MEHKKLYKNDVCEKRKQNSAERKRKWDRRRTEDKPIREKWEELRDEGLPDGRRLLPRKRREGRTMGIWSAVSHTIIIRPCHLETVRWSYSQKSQKLSVYPRQPLKKWKPNKFWLNTVNTLRKHVLGYRTMGTIVLLKPLFMSLQLIFHCIHSLILPVTHKVSTQSILDRFRWQYSWGNWGEETEVKKMIKYTL